MKQKTVQGQDSPPTQPSIGVKQAPFYTYHSKDVHIHTSEMVAHVNVYAHNIFQPLPILSFLYAHVTYLHLHLHLPFFDVHREQ